MTLEAARLEVMTYVTVVVEAGWSAKVNWRRRYGAAQSADLLSLVPMAADAALRNINTLALMFRGRHNQPITHHPGRHKDQLKECEIQRSKKGSGTHFSRPVALFVVAGARAGAPVSFAHSQ
jgi:hypothetical protein